MYILGTPPIRNFVFPDANFKGKRDLERERTVRVCARERERKRGKCNVFGKELMKNNKEGSAAMLWWVCWCVLCCLRASKSVHDRCVCVYVPMIGGCL